MAGKNNFDDLREIYDGVIFCDFDGKQSRRWVMYQAVVGPLYLD